MTEIQDYLDAIEETTDPERILQIVIECGLLHPDWLDEVRLAARHRRLDLPDFQSAMNRQVRREFSWTSRHPVHDLTATAEADAFEIFGGARPERCQSIDFPGEPPC